VNEIRFAYKGIGRSVVAVDYDVYYKKLSIVSRINLVSSHGEHVQWCCEVESQVQDPWRVWQRGRRESVKISLDISPWHLLVL